MLRLDSSLRHISFSLRPIAAARRLLVMAGFAVGGAARIAGHAPARDAPETAQHDNRFGNRTGAAVPARSPYASWRADCVPPAPDVNRLMAFRATLKTSRRRSHTRLGAAFEAVSRSVH